MNSCRQPGRHPTRNCNKLSFFVFSTEHYGFSYSTNSDGFDHYSFSDGPFSKSGLVHAFDPDHIDAKYKMFEQIVLTQLNEKTIVGDNCFECKIGRAHV